MKRWIWLLLFFASTSFAAGPEIFLASHPASAPAGDSCTGNLLFSFHAENNDDATTSANGTQGCSASGTYKSVTLGANAAYSTDYKNDGSYSVKIDSSAAGTYVTLPNTGNWLGMHDKGSILMWIRPIVLTYNTQLFNLSVDATHVVYGYIQTDSTIRVRIRSGSNDEWWTSTDNVSASGSSVCMGWDMTLGSPNNYVKIKVGANAATQHAYADFVSIGSAPSTYTILGTTNNDVHAYFDTIKLFKSTDCSQ